jgi:hypothetical protein
VNKTSIWETCDEHDETPCDDTVLACFTHLIVGGSKLVLTSSLVVSIDFIDNPYHGDHYDDEGEICSMALKDGTTTCHRYWTAYIVSNENPVTLAMTYVRNDETEADAGEHALARVENYPFEIELLLADSGFFDERVLRRSREITATVVHVPKKGDRMKKKLAQFVHDDLPPVQGQQAGTPCPDCSRCLLPER